MDIEQRCFRSAITIDDSPDQPRITGYAAIFDAESEDLGGWREIIRPGAFSGVLGGDTRALVNHNSDLLLGRTLSGTLALSEDALGLRYEIRPPDTQYARDLMVSLKRGDLDQSSFAFQVEKDIWQPPAEGRQYPLRVIERIGRLYDVSPVVYPAYPQTSAEARSMALSLASSGQATGEAQEQAAVRRRSLLRKHLDLSERE